MYFCGQNPLHILDLVMENGLLDHQGSCSNFEQLFKFSSSFGLQLFGCGLHCHGAVSVLFCDGILCPC